MPPSPPDILLISLGTSWAIVPEAFLFPEASFSEVHVLTTASEQISRELPRVRDWFAQNAPGVSLTISRVEGFSDLRSENDQFAFDEVLYRWMLAKRAAGCPYVCLSGGFKTMSASVQKGAELFGTRQIFHVLCDSKPETGEAINQASTNGEIHWIRLSREAGWPQLRQIDAADFPIIEQADAHGDLWIRPGNGNLVDTVRQITEGAHRIAERWEELPSLPFHNLATWPVPDMAWLKEPLSLHDFAWVQSLPKVELHCHLGGFATHGELLQQVRAAADDPVLRSNEAEPTLPECWPRPTRPIPLDDYMKLGNANGSALLRDPGCLRRQVQLLYQQLCEDRVVYAEIRCSPNNYAPQADGNHRSAWQVLSDIRETFQSAMDASKERGEFFCHVNLIVIATRKDSGDRSDISRHLALAITASQHWTKGCRVVGVDLAGFENRETRAAFFEIDFQPIHRVGLAVTAHAGENDDAEGIWQAVFKLNARRLGHALNLASAPDLQRAVADRRIGVEMCPYANCQIKGFHPMEGCGPYPLLTYLRAGIPVSVNTDNLGISAARLSDNLLRLAEICPGITRLELLRLIANAIDTAFLHPWEREHLRSRVMAEIRPA